MLSYLPSGELFAIRGLAICVAVVLHASRVITELALRPEPYSDVKCRPSWHRYIGPATLSAALFMVAVALWKLVFSTPGPTRLEKVWLLNFAVQAAGCMWTTFEHFT